MKQKIEVWKFSAIHGVLAAVFQTVGFFVFAAVFLGTGTFDAITTTTSIATIEPLQTATRANLHGFRRTFFSPHRTESAFIYSANSFGTAFHLTLETGAIVAAIEPARATLGATLRRIDCFPFGAVGFLIFDTEILPFSEDLSWVTFYVSKIRAYHTIVLVTTCFFAV